MSSLDGCRDERVCKQVSNVKHAELGVFEAKKYYSIETDGKLSPVEDLGLSSKAIRSIPDDRRSVVVGLKSANRPNGCYNNPKSRENVGLYWFMRSLCAKEPAALSGSNGINIRSKSTKSCPNMKPHRVLDKPQHCEANKGQQISNRPAIGSDKYELGVVRKKADIEESLERRLAVLRWDAIPGAKKKELVVRKADGYESDTSSELFEIESLSVSTRQSVSTLTRHGCSVISSYAPTPIRNPNNNNDLIRPPRRSVQRRVPNLLSCSSEKSISVSEETYLKTKRCNQLELCVANNVYV